MLAYELGTDSMDEYRHKRGRKSIKVDEETHAMYVKIAQSSKLDMGMLARYFAELCLKYNFIDPEWKSKITEAMAQVEMNRFQFLHDCGAVATAKDSKDKFIYRCVWNQNNRPPQIKQLGDTEEMASAACSACNKTRSIIEGIDEYEKQIERLAAQVKSGVVVKVPSCIHGGRISDDGKTLYCKNPKFEARNRSVENWCKVMIKGANCHSLRWATLVVKGRFVDPER